jgi:hypothetical protein
MIRDMIDFLASSKEPDYGITDGLRPLLIRSLSTNRFWHGVLSGNQGDPEPALPQE